MFRLLFIISLVLSTPLTAVPTFAQSASSDLVAKISAVLPESARVATTTKNVSNYELLLSAAEKVGRELRTTETLPVTGSQTRTLWQLPAGAELDRVFASVVAQMPGEELFSCRGRDCGRSTAWATLVFSQAQLYGQDRNQRYRVVRTSATQLAAVYVIRRGNRRINLLLETLATGDTPADSEPGHSKLSAAQSRANLLTDLMEAGVATLAVVPGEGGVLDANAREQLSEVGEELVNLPAGDVYVVCHMYDDALVAQLLAQSEDCAVEASSLLQQANAEFQKSGVKFYGFAAGPLLPKGRDRIGEVIEKPMANRIVLVRFNQLLYR